MRYQHGSERSVLRIPLDVDGRPLTPVTVPADAAVLAIGAVVYPPVWLYLEIFWHGHGC